MNLNELHFIFFFFFFIWKKMREMYCIKISMAYKGGIIFL